MNSIHRFMTLTLLGSLVTGSLTRAQDNIILKNGTEIAAKVLEVSTGQIKYRRQDNPDGPIYSTGTADVFLIRYANGTKDVLSGSQSITGSPILLSPAVPSAMATPAPALTKLTYHSGLFSRYFSNATGDRLSRNLVQSALVTYPDVMPIFQRGRALRRWSYLTGGSAIALLGAGALVALVGDEGGRTTHRLGTNNNATTNDRVGTGNEQRGDRGSTEVGLALAGGGVLVGVTSLYLAHQASVQFRRAANRYNTHQSTSLRFGSSRRGLGISASLIF